MLVKIKSWEEIKKSHAEMKRLGIPNPGINANMKKYCGKTLEMEDLNPRSEYYGTCKRSVLNADKWMWRYTWHINWYDVLDDKTKRKKTWEEKVTEKLEKISKDLKNLPRNNAKVATTEE